MRAWRIVTGAVWPLAVRHLVAHRSAAGVAAFAVACGVAAVLATQVLYGSVLGSYEATVERFAGRAALQVTNGASGVGEEVVEAIRGVSGVEAVAPSVEGFISIADAPGERLYLYGVDLLTDQSVREYGAPGDAVVSDPMVFLASPDSVALTAELARERGVAMDGSLRVLTPAGIVSLTVRALLGKQHGPASALDGRLAVVDVSVAQELLQLEGRVSAIAIVVAPDADLAAVTRAVTARVGGRGVVETPRSRTNAFARLIANYRYGLMLAAAIAMVVATYFVFSIATIAIAERRRELGLLRVVGLRRSEIGAVVLLEVLVLSAAASGVGVPLGIGLARLLVGAFATNAAVLYGDLGDPALHLGAGAVVASLGLGITTPLLAIVGPLRRLLHVSPHAAIVEPWHAARARWSVGVGVLVVLGAVSVWMARSRLPITVGHAGIVAILGVVVGTAGCGPSVVGVLARLGDRLASAAGRPLLLLACRGIRADTRAIAVSCSALLVSLAGTIAVATWITSLAATLQATFDGAFANVDLVVSAGAEPFASDTIRIPASVAAGIAMRPEVAAVNPVRVDTLAFGDARVLVVAGDARLYRDGRRRLVLTEGEPRAVVEALVAGSGVVVNQTFATRFGHRPGAMLTLGTPTGPLVVRVVGIHVDLTPGDLGTVHLDRRLYERWWRDTTASFVEISLRRPDDRATLIDAIRTRWGEPHRLVMLTLAQVRAEYDAMLRKLAGMVSPLLGVAIASALVGMLSGRVASMIARRRVGAILRVAGATRRQLARVHGVEAGMVAAVAVVVAAVAGAGLGRLQVEILLRGMLGMSVAYAYPGTAVSLGGTVIVLASAAVGWLLARRAGYAEFRDVFR